ncbi:MAG TPA: hypothetical protein VG053_06265 [Solirubrobacteraceae bacterium]|jgi:hypothetical protein|nr:hypothetical protein [Solirubrobacteraceae bacterium]
MPEQPRKLDDLDGVELKASDAFLAMGRFLRAYFDRTKGKGDIATICSDVEVEDDRISTDPAAISDWEKAIKEVLDE